MASEDSWDACLTAAWPGQDTPFNATYDALMSVHTPGWWLVEDAVVATIDVICQHTGRGVCLNGHAYDFIRFARGGNPLIQVDPVRVSPRMSLSPSLAEVRSLIFRGGQRAWLFGADLYIFPIERHSHWYIVMIDILYQRVWVYDGLPGSSAGYEDKVARCFRLLSRIRDDLDPDTFTFHRLAGPRQPNGFDCGVFIIFMAARVIPHVPTGGVMPDLDWPPENFDIRSWVVNKVLNG